MHDKGGTGRSYIAYLLARGCYVQCRISTMFEDRMEEILLLAAQSAFSICVVTDVKYRVRHVILSVAAHNEHRVPIAQWGPWLTCCAGPASTTVRTIWAYHPMGL